MPAYISFDNIFYFVFVVHFHLLLQLLGLSHAQNRTNENFAHMCAPLCVCIDVVVVAVVVVSACEYIPTQLSR